MNKDTGRLTIYLIAYLLINIFFLSTVRGEANSDNRKKVSQEQLSGIQATYQSSTLDICLTYEPESLYPYTSSYYKDIILEAVYDGPIDDVSFTYSPVILQQIPTLDNGGAVLNVVTVNEGDEVVLNNGSVGNLTVGQIIRPSGCYSSSCAILYEGGQIQMDQLEVTFDLIPGLTWSDGTPLTAADSVFSFNLTSDPVTPGSKFLVDRTASYINTSTTQSIWTGLPGYYVFKFYTYYFTPYPEHIWGSYTPEELITAPVSSRTPMGWGPYVIDEWVDGSHISMHANPNYFRSSEGLPKFDDLIVHFSDNLMADWLAGNCDVAPETSYIPLSYLWDYEDQGLMKVITTPTTVWEHLDFGILPVEDYEGFTGQTLAFQDANVRKAFAYCIDREAIAETYAERVGSTLLTNAYILPSHPYYPTDATEYSFNPTLGQSLLSTAGWVDTNGNGIRDKDGIEFSLELITTTSPSRVLTANMIADDMIDCGVEVIPVPLPASELYLDGPEGPIFGRQFDLAMFAWLTGHEPPCGLYLSAQIPGYWDPNSWGGTNVPGYINYAYDSACVHALTSITEDDELLYHQEAVRIFTQDIPVLPLYSSIRYGITTPYLEGFTLNETGIPLWNIETFGTISIPATIPITGGILTSDIDQTNYFFPADTFTDTVIVTHTPVFFLDTPDSGDLESIQHVFEVTAVFSDTGQTAYPTQNYEVTIQYTNSEQGPVIEDTLALYYWDGVQWVEEPSSTVDVINNTITATPDHFSLWSVLGETNTIFLPMMSR
jgi:peptide/nickel transport system substrate-binding protein